MVGIIVNLSCTGNSSHVSLWKNLSVVDIKIDSQIMAQLMFKKYSQIITQLMFKYILKL